MTEDPVPALAEPPATPSLAVPAPAGLPAADPADPRRLRAALTAAVALLPALPAADPADRYGVAPLTVLWLESLPSHATRRAYYRDLTNWLDWCRRTMLDPLAARRADVDAWKALQTATGHDQVARPAKPATVARRLSAVSSWYAYLLTNDACDRNPAAAVKPPKVAGTTTKAPVLSEEQTARLLDHAEHRAATLNTEAAWRDAAVVALLFYTAVRVSAITGATTADLDTEAGYRVLRFAKKGGGRDYVRLDGEVLRPLTTYLRLRATRLGVAAEELDGPLLATTPHPHDPAKPGGKPLRQRDVSTTLRTLASQAGLPVAARISPHSGRGTVITTLLGRGVPLPRVQDLAGHADPRTTRGYDAANHKLATSAVGDLTIILAAHRAPPPGAGEHAPDPGRGD
ncbi:hypothetical protein DPM19_17705 [Actinomadura craniellae]|uniref:Integrase n=1 Tax=Actinomadura craniellae TaxID=2231787 RepID=A0A365H4S8_9ACTN|nr:tyrosine-type recombinase/integrase [Actinomadura craniellae]RAY14107.1 hypothetical protein DPM19_17705 [Actinomadura craniellae]